jgi:hypothetical protein
MALIRTEGWYAGVLAFLVLAFHVLSLNRLAVGQAIGVVPANEEVATYGHSGGRETGRFKGEGGA